MRPAFLIAFYKMEESEKEQKVGAVDLEADGTPPQVWDPRPLRGWAGSSSAEFTFLC